jgi:hypothetical protein
MKQELFSTQNLSVASVLMTHGFKMVTFTHIVRSDGKQSKEFWFEASSKHCDYKAEQVAYYVTKGSEDLRQIKPEDPVLWMRGVLTNRNTLVEIVKTAPRMVEIKNGSRRALISADASDELKRQIAEML